MFAMTAITHNQLLDATLPLRSAELFGNLYVPQNATGIVIFAHGSGSGRFSPRNRSVAEQLNQANLATLLFDLLTQEEEQIDNITREWRFNIPLLAERFIQATDWVLAHPQLNHLKIGYFGASTGAAAALIAAAHHVNQVGAVVSRGGRPDLAEEKLHFVKAPTLFIVGSLDDVVIQLNEKAKANMPASTIKKLMLVEGATHLFEEAGKLNEVVKLTKQWFLQYLY